MNPAKIFEQAVCMALRRAELGAGVHLRPWQSLRFDGSWNEEADKEFPLVDIRFATEAVNEDQFTLVCAGLITPITKTDDDKDHAVISRLYDASYSVISGIFKSFISGTGDYYTQFLADVAEIAPNVVNIGGVTLDNPSAPESADGTNSLAIGISIHFSYAG